MITTLANIYQIDGRFYISLIFDIDWKDTVSVHNAIKLNPAKSPVLAEKIRSIP